MSDTPPVLTKDEVEALVSTYEMAEEENAGAEWAEAMLRDARSAVVKLARYYLGVDY